MDDIAKQNVLMFSGAIAGMGAFWLIVLGLIRGSVSQVLGGVVVGAVSAVCFVLYSRALKSAKDRPDDR